MSKNLHKFKKDAFDSVYLNSMMYLTINEIDKLLIDLLKVAKTSIYIVTPYLDYPDSIPKDRERKTLKTKKWWYDTLVKNGWQPLKSSNILCKKI